MTGNFFLPGADKNTRQKICLVPDKKHPANISLPGLFLPGVVCQVLHQTNYLPGVFWPLPGILGTRQIARIL